MKLVSRQAPRQLLCWCTRGPEEEHEKDGRQRSCRMVAMRPTCRAGGVAGGSSPHPQQDPGFHQQVACPPAQKVMGKVQPMKRSSWWKPQHLLTWGGALALILTCLHACPFLTARINPLANKHPANTQSLHKPSLTFIPYKC